MPTRTPKDPRVRKLRSQAGGFKRRGNLAKAEECQRELKAITAEDYIKRLVDSAPPLTLAQRDRLASLLRPAASNGGGADAAA
ncbi:hypothetical protein [Jiangella rhizosphaerae]|uniref:Uncharacterized protein n=1 Tax=Jiangella rhizosphaerae TaxID=2293569 RepID=A0A418KPP3_9ACTN|nr:hypothetical protein [Jiangella rhizosphaerae]RIQ21258.1 hypothetical protein DY240_15665 [Jiangella rhizosphaerae]